MSTNRNQKAYIRIDGSGRDVAGSLILRNKKPGNGKWREVLAYECCNSTPGTTTTTTSSQPLNIGTFYSGGIIASSNIIEGQIMVVDLNDLGFYTYKDMFNGSTGAIGTALKTGQSNTDAILSADFGATAAYAARSSGIFDWDLPSRDELEQVFNNVALINNGISVNGGDTIPSTSTIWTSTEADAANAEMIDFLTGAVNNVPKSIFFGVRAVRWVNI